MAITSEQIDNTLKKHNLDFEVKTFQEKNPFNGQQLKFFGTYRTDTKEVFQTGLTKAYHTIQNREAYQTLVDLSDVGDVNLVRAGSWNNGIETFAQVDINGGFPVGGNSQDIVQQRCTFYKRHDGNGGLAFFITPFRAACANACSALLKKARQSQILRIRHTVSGQDRLKILAQQYQIIEGAFSETQQVYNELADTPIKKETVAEVLNRLYPVLPDSSKRAQSVAKEAQATIGQFVSDADGGLIAWNTAWNLYNAVTRYTTHVEKGYSNKEKSLLLGSGVEKIETALETIQRVCS